MALGPRLQLLLESLQKLLRRNAYNHAKRLLKRTRPVDVAVVMRFLSPSQQQKVFELLPDDESRAQTLSEADANIRTAVLAERPHEELLRLLKLMSADDQADLLEDLKIWQASGMPLLEQAVRLHHIAVQIHPFPNGNGRWSRMVANIWLKLQGAEPIEWPETTIGTASTVRGEYLEAVKAADRGDYTKLLAMHQRFAPSSGEP